MNKQISFNVLISLGILESQRHKQEALSCNCCKKTYKATLPNGISSKKSYAPSASAIICSLRYLMGMPHFRMAISPEILGVKLSSSTMFNMAEELANKANRIYLFLEKLASNSYRAGIDDTRMKILSPCNSEHKERSGFRTSVLVSELEAPFLDKEGEIIKSSKIFLFQTGRQVAGEFLDHILEHRNKEGPIIIMSDAHKTNNSKIYSDSCNQAYCLVHARRYFWEIKENYPEIIPKILDYFSSIFFIDKECRELNIFGKKRLLKHQKESSKILVKIFLICRSWLKEKKAEPNSSLGKAMKYFLTHFSLLCKFLRFENCPIENNESERALKKVISHRKNSLFYKTEIGAGIGDIIMSLGFTAQEAGISPTKYFEDILTNFDDKESIENWLPWNWKETRKLSLFDEKSKVA